MKIHGSTEANLTAALRSARRLHGHPVHTETIGHWTELLHITRRKLSTDPSRRTDAVMKLIADLEAEVAGHQTQQKAI